MTLRLRDFAGRSRLAKRRGRLLRPRPRWADPATPRDAALLAHLLFDDGQADCVTGAISVIELTLALLTSWRFRVNVAEPALDGALSRQIAPADPDFGGWIEEVFGGSSRSATSRLAQLAQVVEARCVSDGLAVADLPWSAKALAGALRSAGMAGNDDDELEPDPITHLRLIARGVEVLGGVDVRPGARASEARLISDDAWVDFRITPVVAAASPVCRVDFGVRLQSADPMGTLYLTYGSGGASEERITLTPRGRMRYAAYVSVAGLRTIRWKPDDAEGEATFSLLTARPAPLVRVRDMLTGAARATFDRLSLALQKSDPGKSDPGENDREALELCRLLTRELGAHVHADRSYASWIRRHEVRGAEAMRAGERALTGLKDAPRISLVVRLGTGRDEAVDATVQALLAQIYPHWELHLLSAASCDASSRDQLRACAARDPRIRLRLGQDRGSPVADIAFEELTGDWVGVLAPGDILASHALLRVIELVTTRPQLRLVYSDEDHLGEGGERCDPLMKPDFSPELLLGRDYLGRLVLQRLDELRAAGSWRPEFGTAQDYDLALRLIERVGGGAVAHIPEVLCHRAKSGAGWFDAPATEERVHAVRQHLARTDRLAQVEPLASGALRLCNTLPEPPPLVSLIIPTRDRADLLTKGVGSILDRSTYPAFEIVIVDNGSAEAETLQVLDHLQRDGRVRVLEDAGDFNFSRLNNLAVRHCRGDIVALVNNDIEVISPDWIEEMAGWALQKDVGCVGALLYYPGGQVQHAGVVLGLGGVADHVFKLATSEALHDHWRLAVVHEVSAVTGACLFIRKALYEAMGGLDETLKVSFNDVDLCLRVRQAGYRNLLTPFAELHHHESVSRGPEQSDRNAARFEAEISFMYDRWGAELAADPFYSPNLTLTAPDYRLRWLDE